MEVEIMKRFIGLLCGVLIVSSLTVFAATSTSFTVNGVSVVGQVSYYDSAGGNPFDSDSVTATTTSGAALDEIKAKAYLYNGSTLLSSNSELSYNSNYVSAYTSKYTSDGNNGKGYHYGLHNQKSNYDYTYVTW
jgi:hypothetical protein